MKNFFTRKTLNDIKPLLKLNKLRVDHNNNINKTKLEFFTEEPHFEIKENIFDKDVYELPVLRFISKHYSKLHRNELISLLELKDDKITRYITKYQRNIDDEIFEKYKLNPSTFSFYKSHNEKREYKISNKYYQEKIKPNIDWEYLILSEEHKIDIDYINRKKSIDKNLKKVLIKTIKKNNKLYNIYIEKKRLEDNKQKSIAFYAKKYKLTPNEHTYILDKINEYKTKYQIEKEKLDKLLPNATFTESGNVITQTGSDINNLDSLQAIASMTVVNTGGHTVINFNNRNLVVNGTLTLSNDRYTLLFNIHTSNFGLEVNGSNAELNIGRVDTINGSNRYYQRSILKFDRDTSSPASNTEGDILITNDGTLNWTAGILENKQSIVFDTNSNVNLTSGVLYGTRSGSSRIRQLSTNLSINAPNNEFFQTTGSLRFDFFQAPQMAIGFFPNHSGAGGFQVLSGAISGGSDDIFEFRRYRSAGLTYDYDAFGNARLEFVNSFEGLIITGTHNRNTSNTHQPSTIHYKEFRLQFRDDRETPIPNVRYFFQSTQNLGTDNTPIPSNIRWNDGNSIDLTNPQVIEGQANIDGLSPVIKVMTQFDIQGQSLGGTLGNTNASWNGRGMPIKFYRSQSNDNFNGYDILASSFANFRENRRIDLVGADVNTINFELREDENLSTDNEATIVNRPYVSNLQELYDNAQQHQRVASDLSSSRIGDYFIIEGDQVLTDLNLEFNPLLTSEFIYVENTNTLRIKLGTSNNGNLSNHILQPTNNLNLLRANSISFVNGGSIGNVRTVETSTNLVRLVLLTPNNAVYKGTVSNGGSSTGIDYTIIDNGVIAIQGQQNSLVTLVISPSGFDERMMGFNLGENGIIQALDFIPIADFEVDSTSITDNLDITYNDTDQSLTIQYQSNTDVRFSSDLYSSLLNFIRSTEAYLDAVLDIEDINLLSIFSVGNLAQKDTLTTRWTIQDDREPIAQFLIPIWITPAQENTNILTPRNNVRSFISIIFVNTSVEVDNDAIRQINNQENQRIIDLLNSINNNVLNNISDNVNDNKTQLEQINEDVMTNNNLLLRSNPDARAQKIIQLFNEENYQSLPAGSWIFNEFRGIATGDTVVTSFSIDFIDSIGFTRLSITNNAVDNISGIISRPIPEQSYRGIIQVDIHVRNATVDNMDNALDRSFQLRLSLSNGVGTTDNRNQVLSNTIELEDIGDTTQVLPFNFLTLEDFTFDHLNLLFSLETDNVVFLIQRIEFKVHQASDLDALIEDNNENNENNLTNIINTETGLIRDRIDTTATRINNQLITNNNNIKAINRNPRLYNDVNLYDLSNFSNFTHFTITNLTGSLDTPSSIQTVVRNNLQYEVVAPQTQEINFIITRTFGNEITQINDRAYIVLEFLNNSDDEKTIGITASLSLNDRGTVDFNELDSEIVYFNDIDNDIQRYYFNLPIKEAFTFNKINFKISFEGRDIRFNIHSIKLYQIGLSPSIDDLTNIQNNTNQIINDTDASQVILNQVFAEATAIKEQTDKLNFNDDDDVKATLDNEEVNTTIENISKQANAVIEEQP